MLWLITLPIRSARRRAAEKAAAYQLELEMVAAMPEPMKEEYWRQKHADAQAKAGPSKLVGFLSDVGPPSSHDRPPPLRHRATLIRSHHGVADRVGETGLRRSPAPFGRAGLSNDRVSCGAALSGPLPQATHARKQ
jgi:hypothetical protein